MVITELKPKQQAHRKSSRKHEGVRTPTARNAIVRDRDTGAYHAQVDNGELADSLNAIALRLNALELNVSKLMRNDAVDRGYAAPTLPSNVVPMDSGRKAKEQSKAVQVPLPSPGNEVLATEVLALPAPKPTVVEVEPPLKTADVEPKHIGRADPVTSGEPAANDSCIPDETVEQLSQFTTEKPETMERLAESYDMDLVEASQILYREYLKRNAQCIKDHGEPRKLIREQRTVRKDGVSFVEEINLGKLDYVQAKSCSSGFADWWNETESRMKYLRSLAEGRRVGEATSNRAPLTKGEAKYRKRVRLRDVASRKPARPDRFRHVDTVANKLHVDGPGVTTVSQYAAITTALWSGYQKTRKLLGMQPTVRGRRKLDRYEILDATTPPTGDGERKASNVQTVDTDSSTAELVRRYQRNGIGY